ncbi:TadE/TadG family type IV pilus assembly protein [Symmachiella dynata]|uniref:TadE/TadG family type IV pilus assembly protein n=1 Tax=Symmachiella dynata TaxID=2527995 RepID=UPI0018D2EE64|nr:TadE family protein [Symmachiella dynata]
MEFAICLPVIALMFMGSIEAASMIFLKEALTVSSYEGARTAAKYDSETDDVVAKVEAMLELRNVSGAVITISPAEVSSAERGDQITVTVSIPCNANSLVPLQFFNDQLITVQSIMVRE